MLLTPPRMLDISVGVVFILFDIAMYVFSYYLTLDHADDPKIQHLNLIFIVYGCAQSLIGFTAGLWLARITQVETAALEDEEILLIEKA